MTKFVKVLIFLCALSGFGEVAFGEDYGDLYREPKYNYTYKEALEKAILFFEGQRSGRLPANQRVNWRGNSALFDGKSDRVNLVGGYYDAGDNVKFLWPMAFTTTLLSWAAIEYPNQISSAKQLQYLQQAIRWGTDYILQSYPNPTTLYTQVGDANQDHQCWERPEDMDTPRTVYKITASDPGTEAAADACAALASAAIALKKVDASYAGRLLNQAKSLFAFADKYRGTYKASCPFYCSYSGYQDELLWAAAWLYKASGDGKYLSYVTSNQGWSQAVSEFSWDNKFAGVQVLLAKEFLAGKQSLNDYKAKADSFVCSLMPQSSTVQVHTTAGGLLFFRDAANIQYASSASMLLTIYGKALAAAKIPEIQCGSVKFTPAKIKEFAKSQVDYVLGLNPRKLSYMVGYGRKWPQQLHHRGASIPSIGALPLKVGCEEGYSRWFSNAKPNPNLHVGAIIGGPDQNDEFKDLRSDHTHLEPTTYINAAFVGAMAPWVTSKNDAGCLNLRLPVEANMTVDVAKIM